VIKPKCLAEIANAIGRTLKDSEVQGIEDAITRHLNMLARRNKSEFLAMSRHERLTAAAKSAAEEVLAAGERKAANAARNIVAQKVNLELMEKNTRPGEAMAKGLYRVLNQAEVDIRGISHDYFSQIANTIMAAEPRFFELIENKESVRDFVREVSGIDTGNKLAKSGAKEWIAASEAMRERFNRGGGDIGKLRYDWLPQPHDQARVLKAGMQQWIDDTIQWVPRDWYRDNTGAPLDETGMRAALAEMYEPISTGGISELEPGQKGTSALANRNAEHRVLHFKDADSYLAYMDKYGKGTVFEAMQRHVANFSREIGLLEHFGPNAENTFQYLNDTAIKHDLKQKKTGVLLVSNDEVWKTMSNHYSQAIDPKWAEIGQGVRNFTSAAKLQGNLLSSFADLPTFALALQYNHLPVLENVAGFAKRLLVSDKEAIEWANVNGIMADSVISGMNRWAGDNLAQGWTGKLAHTTQKVTLMNRWTDEAKRTFAIAFQKAITKISRGTWDGMDAADRAKYEFHGIDEATFNVWKQATPEKWRGTDMLTARAIRAIEGLDIATKDKAVGKFLGMIAEEADFAVNSTDLATRARVSSVGQRGTFNGELGRALFLFKSFPMSLISRQLTRLQQIEGTGAKLQYSASLLISLTLFGALSMQAKDIVAGKDPRDMTGKGGSDKAMLARFWMAAFAQGGGAGIFGDIAYTGVGGNARGGQPNWTNLFGPVIGTGLDLSNATLGQVGKALNHQQTNIGADAFRIARSNTPFLNLWFAKTALDRAMFHEAQDRLSPGYLGRMQAAYAKDYGGTYWAPPQRGNIFQGTAKMPERGPNLKTAIGGR